jgi:hypothetical protein
MLYRLKNLTWQHDPHHAQNQRRRRSRPIHNHGLLLVFRTISTSLSFFLTFCHNNLLFCFAYYVHNKQEPTTPPLLKLNLLSFLCLIVVVVVVPRSSSDGMLCSESQARWRRRRGCGGGGGGGTRVACLQGISRI